MHLPVNGPKLTPSQDSPVSIAAFPHLGFSAHEEVSSWHAEEHLRVPPENDELNFAHVSIEPNFVPSHDSPGSSWLLPQVGIDMQPDVLSLQSLVHFKVPPIKLVNWVQLLIEPNVF